MQSTSSNTTFRSGMELFHRAKVVRLRSHHDKYLLADEDEESVTQDRNGSSRNSKWTVELIPEFDNLLRLKSCYGKYLTASNQPLLLGVTGRKVVQSVPRRLDSSVEWEPVRDGAQVKLKTRYGNFLRANGGLPPWRNSVTHDIPHRTATQDWILWDVDVLEIHVESPAPPPIPHSDSLDFDSSTPSAVSIKSSAFSRQEVCVCMYVYKLMHLIHSSMLIIASSWFILGTTLSYDMEIVDFASESIFDSSGDYKNVFCWCKF